MKSFSFKWRYAINRIMMVSLFLTAAIIVGILTANVTCNTILFQMPGAVSFEFREFVYSVILIFTYVCCGIFSAIILLFKREDIDRTVANMGTYQKQDLIAALQKDLEEEEKINSKIVQMQRK